MVLAVIPARGGSKGIPRKNVRLMGGKPLIYYAIENAKKCPLIDHVAVSTDDEEISSIAKMYGVEVVTRGEELSGDAVTLDPVIYDAVLQMETGKGVRYDVVVTLQPTSPLLTEKTLTDALRAFQEQDADTFISAINKPHLTWGKSDGAFVPNYSERKNRQQLPPNYLETGAFLITRRDCMTAGNRIGKHSSICEMPEQEATDIDTMEDWFVCQAALNKKKIVFRVDGYREIGMGHVYRCLNLAYALIGHEIIFASLKVHKEGTQKLKESNIAVWECENEEDFFERLLEYRPDIIVNDCLDTEAFYMKRLKGLAPRVVTIEDLGTGADHADAVINALYENEGKQETGSYYGENYVCLRDEFVISEPSGFREQAGDILVIFGGSDPGNFTGRIYRIAEKLQKQYEGIRFHFVLGLAYVDKDGLVRTNEQERIYVYRDVKRLSQLMGKADFAITSQGRTVYELAAMQVPSMVLAQNERETMHTFAQMKNGFLNLGLGADVSDETIENTLGWILKTPQIREEMHKLMRQHDLKHGVKRVVDIILGN